MRSLRQIGMEEECLANGVKMPARMIHKVSGETYEVPYGRTKEHFILSISRLRLNQMILTGFALLFLTAGQLLFSCGKA